MSGRKNTLPPYHAIVAADMSQATITSPVTTIDHLDNVSIQLNFIGTPTGNFSVQGSLDQKNWVSLTLSPSPAATGSASQILLDLNQLSFPYIQVIYTRVSGTGTLDMYISAKML